MIDKAEWEEEEGEEKEAGGGKEECKDRRVGGWPSMTRYINNRASVVGK